MKELQPFSLEEWDPSLRHVIDDMNGKPLNIHALMAHNPELLNAWWAFRKYAVNGGSLGREKGELVILRVAARLGSWYEWASHVDRSLSIGMSREKIDAVLGDHTKLEPEDAALIEAIDELLVDRRLSTNMLERLESHFDRQQVLDIIAIHGMYVTLGCMIETWHLELDETVSSRLPKSVSIEAMKAGIASKQQPDSPQGKA